MATFDDIERALREAGFVVTGSIDERREPVAQIYTCRRSALRVVVPTVPEPRMLDVRAPYPDAASLLQTPAVDEALRFIAASPDRAPTDLPQTADEIAANVRAWIAKAQGD